MFDHESRWQIPSAFVSRHLYPHYSSNSLEVNAEEFNTEQIIDHTSLPPSPQSVAMWSKLAYFLVLGASLNYIAACPLPTARAVIPKFERCHPDAGHLRKRSFQILKDGIRSGFQKGRTALGARYLFLFSKDGVVFDIGKQVKLADHESLATKAILSEAEKSPVLMEKGLKELGGKESAIQPNKSRSSQAAFRGLRQIQESQNNVLHN